MLKIDPSICCVVFHDVDLLPEDDRNIYSCSNQPKHMSVAVDKFNYILPYHGLVGGVLAITVNQFKLVNGYSNCYWGWGAEGKIWFEPNLSEHTWYANFKTKMMTYSVDLKQRVYKYIDLLKRSHVTECFATNCKSLTRIEFLDF